MLLALWLLNVGVFPGQALAGPRTEYKVKAAFLYHFVQFTEWPEEAFSQNNSRIHICTYGKNSFEGLLKKTFDGKSVNARRFTVQSSVSAQDVHACHVVFVDRTVDLSKKDVQRVFEQSQTLLVGETDDFLESGGMIQFFEADKKIRFAVNPDALDRNNI
ncbi:MAG: YfiR family protein, partial [Nitrospirales bacterium]